MEKRHIFIPSGKDPRFCGHVVSRPGRTWGSSTCGLPVTNVAVHAPGCTTAQPERPHLTVVPTQEAS